MSSGPSRAKEQRDEVKKRCYPLCRHFRCGRNALVFLTKYYRGRPRKVAFCRWVGDLCSGPECQYAYCERRALLPDGTCGLALRALTQTKKDMLREIEEAELDVGVKEIVRRRLRHRAFIE